MILTKAQIDALEKIINEKMAGLDENEVLKKAKLSPRFFERFHNHEWDKISKRNIDLLSAYLQISDEVNEILTESYDFNRRAEYLYDMTLIMTLEQLEETIAFAESLLHKQ